MTVRRENEILNRQNDDVVADWQALNSISTKRLRVRSFEKSLFTLLVLVFVFFPGMIPKAIAEHDVDESQTVEIGDTVYFNVNGGAGAVPPQSVTIGDTVYLPTAFVRENHDLIGLGIHH